VAHRRGTVRLAALTAGLALLAGAAPAAGVASPRVRSGGARDALLWATVNVCDTVGHPDGMGVRGSMPGTGDRRDQLFMRLRLQFLRRSDGTWHNVGRAGDSGFIFVGRGAARVRQAGRTFTLTPPDADQPPFLMRGLVTFEWRRGGVVLRRARRFTGGGHPGTGGADPPNFSAPTCSIR
jgi:hypothetical protein